MGTMERRVDFAAGQDSGVALKVRAVARSEVCEGSWNRPACGSNAVDARHTVPDARCAPGSAGTDLLPSGADASTRGDSSSSISSANFAQFVAKGYGSLLAMDARAMIHTASLEELLNTGVPISPHEAVAIVQQLLLADDSPAEEIDVTPADVILHANGLVDCRCGLASVEALGHLLDGILPSGGGKALINVDDTALLLLDHQDGLFLTVKDITVAELRANVIALDQYRLAAGTSIASSKVRNQLICLCKHQLNMSW